MFFPPQEVITMLLEECCDKHSNKKKCVGDIEAYDETLPPNSIKFNENVNNKKFTSVKRPICQYVEFKILQFALVHMINFTSLVTITLLNPTGFETRHY